jgi:hypothetical protein
MTDKEYVIRAAKQMNVDLIKPTRGLKDIIGTDWSSGFGKSVIDAQNWADARAQLNAFAQKRAA